jgi:hypothetical protein
MVESVRNFVPMTAPMERTEMKATIQVDGHTASLDPAPEEEDNSRAGDCFKGLNNRL